MTRVAAYWGKRRTTTEACPLGKDAKGVCFRIDDKLRYGYENCKHYKRSSMPETKSGLGTCIVLCSAPRKKEGKGK